MHCHDRFYWAGGWVNASSRELIDVINPATEMVEGRVAVATDDDVHSAVRAARDAFPCWSNSLVEKRIAMLDSIREGLSSRSTELAELITREMGMPSSKSYGEQVQPAFEMLTDFISVAKHYQFERSNYLTTIKREAVGVCGLIMPWNFPLVQIAGKLFPALAAGCTVVLKPSEIAPLSAMMLAEIIDDACLPPGVFNLVNGFGPSAGAALAADPEVDMISFTGSTRTGISISKAASDSLKRVTLELGGKSAYIIFDDTDLTAAVDSCV